MFYYIKGTLVYTDPSSAVIDTGGVAYKMTVSASTLSQISSLRNDVKLYTYMAVREDAVSGGTSFHKNSIKRDASVEGIAGESCQREGNVDAF